MHFRLDEWVDFARDVVDNATATAMQRHLENGCSDCARVLQIWKRLREIGLRECLYEPPDNVLRLVKSSYAIHGNRAADFGVPTLARLVFDSFSQPLPVGVRSAEPSARRLLYEFDRYEIDLHLEPQYDSGNFSLIGQILAREEPGCAVDRIPVALIADGKSVVDSETGPLGEFRLECHPKGPLQLRFEPSQGNSFYILLTNSVRRSLFSPRDEKKETSSSSAKRRRKKL